MYVKCPIQRKIRIDAVVTFFDLVFERNYYFSGEAHNFWEIVFVLSGNVGITADKEVYILKSGNAILHPPMQFHNIWSENGTAPEIVILSFYASKMPELTGNIFNFTSEMADELRRLCQLAKTIFTYERSQVELTHIKNGKESDASFFLCQLESMLHTLFASVNSGLSVHQSQSAKNYMFILSVLEQNIYRKLTISQIAKLCNMSESNLKKVFNKYAAKGIMNYFNTIKIKKAAQCIGSGMSIKETACLLGFSDQNYFSTVFKRVMGVSPAKYK